MHINRRKFLEDSGRAALAGLVSTRIPAGNLWTNGYVNSNPVNIGVIGTGSRGSWLIKLLQNTSDARVMACSDVIPSRLQQGIQLATPGCNGYSDYRQLHDNREVDAVIVATPLSLHYPMVKAAVEAGKHVYCEKTMCFTAEESVNLGAVLHDTGLVFQVGYQHRYNPLYRKIKEIIRSEDFGPVTHVECYWNRNGNWRRPVDDPKLERLINWRMYREYSGGLMAELSSHQIDIVNWILEDMPTSVMGYGGIDYWKDGRETFDHVHGVFKYSNGVQATYTCLTTNAHQGYQMLLYGKNATVQVTGEQGHQASLFVEPAWMNQSREVAGVDGVSGATMKVWEPGKGIPILAGDQPGDDAEPTGKALESFIACIRDNKMPLSSYPNGRDTAICVAKANEAMEQAETVVF